MARQVVVDIVGDSRKFTKSLDQATTSTNKFKNVLTGIGQGIGQGVFGLVADGLRLTVDAMKDSIANASKLQQSTGAVQSVFEDAAGSIEKFADSAATNLGLSKNQVKEMAAVMGAQLKGMGFSLEDSADKTKLLQSRAADMAATFGGETKDAVEAITSLMRGERDPIEKFGVSIKQADVNARILALGLDTSTAAAKKNAEAVAAMDLLMEQTADTQGTFAKESDSLAGSTQIMNARLENLSATFGEKLLPIVTAIVGFVVDSVIPAFEALFGAIDSFTSSFSGAVDSTSEEARTFQEILTLLADGFKETFAAIGKIVSAAVKLITTLWQMFGKDILNVVKIYFSYARDTIKNFLSIIEGIIKVITSAIKGDWNGVWNGIKQIIGSVFDQIKNIVNLGMTLIKNIISTVWNAVSTTIKNVLDGIWKKVTSTFTNIVNTIRGMPGKITSAASGMFNGILKAFKSVINSIISGWNSLKFTLPSATIDFGPLGKQTIGGFTLGTPNLPYLHAGGIVPGTSGEDVLAILQAGERVIPRNRAGGETVIVNFNAPVFADELFMDDLARKLAMRLRTVGG